MKKQKGIYRMPKERFIRLDVGCGSNKQHGYVGMDIRKIKGVDIVHDAERVFVIILIRFLISDTLKLLVKLLT